MALKIVFSDVAAEMLVTIGELIENKWSKKEAYKFLEKVHKTFGLIATQPYMFKASSFDENVRIGYLSKQTSFYYEIHENEIIILFFWDNRQDPIFSG
ncbi:MAG: type II toxin-antitoxin system RelE/ParE family toxin [Sphingobacteriales bacterium]